MKNIGILTFHASNNCGSMLQAFALQHTLLKKMDKNAEIIDFSNEKQKNMYSLFRKVDGLKPVLINIVTFLFFYRMQTHYNDYITFKNKRMILSEKSYSRKEEIEANYSAIIAGSDQIWNILCPDADDAYFLSFVHGVKKIAYAPSFGANNPIKCSSNPDKYCDYLKDFSFLSVRENNGKKWINEMTGQSIPVLLDPTLLLTSDEWDIEIPSNNNRKEDYIFYYAFDYSKEVNRYVYSFAKKSGMPVYILDARGWLKRGFIDGLKLTSHSGPETFVNLIRNAKYVITTSFHGTAFSILYHKKFIFLNSSIHREDDDRVFTLLERLKLTDRIVNMESEKIEPPLFDCDFEECDALLSKERTVAFNYLYEAVNGR